MNKWGDTETHRAESQHKLIYGLFVFFKKTLTFIDVIGLPWNAQISSATVRWIATNAYSCITQPCLIQNISIPLKSFLPCQFPLSPPLSRGHHCLVSFTEIVLPGPERYVNGFVPYEFLCPVSLVSVVVLRFHHVVGISSSFLLLSSIHCAHRTTLCLSSLLSSDSCVVSVFWLLCLSTCVEIFLWISVFIVPGWMPGSGIARSEGRWMFNFMGSCQRVF